MDDEILFHGDSRFSSDLRLCRIVRGRGGLFVHRLISRPGRQRRIGRQQLFGARDL
jgi:hypothetical protein